MPPIADGFRADRCPCGAPAPYADCCGRWHAGVQRLQAPTAEALMRSRYAAYVLDLRPYLLDTWHPRTRPLTLAPAAPGLHWLGLAVRRHEVIDDEHASVEFVARSKLGGRADRSKLGGRADRSKLGGRADRMHVVSRFERVDGRWLYVDDADAR